MNVADSGNDWFSGVLSPVVTPFNADLTPDADRLIHHCQWLLSQNVGLAVFGTNSEANSLSVDEKIELLDRLVDAGIDPGRMMPGTGCCALSDSVKLTRKAVELNCRGTLILPPFYYKGVSDDGLYDSYARIIDQVGDARLNIYLYHIPQMSSVPIPLNLIERLIANYPDTIAGIKDSSGDWDNTKAMLDRQWDNFRVFAGSESLLLANMRNGGAGCISATANVNPAAICRLYDEWQDEHSDIKQKNLDEVRGIFQKYPMIPALKAAMAHYGKDPAWTTVRPPLVTLTGDQQAALAADLKKIGFVMPGLKS